MRLPTSFAPNTFYLSLIAKGFVKEISIGEQYNKQTYRNRADFLASNGVISFSIPVRKIGYPSPPTECVHISEHGQWRDKLWQLVKSDYHSSPYWEHYAEYIKECVYNPTPRLVDYNHQWLSLICRLMGLPVPSLVVTEEDLFAEAIDMKYIKRLASPRRYWQVFEQKWGFRPYLSSVDMLLNLGPESKLILCEGGQNA